MLHRLGLLLGYWGARMIAEVKWVVTDINQVYAGHIKLYGTSISQYIIYIIIMYIYVRMYIPLYREVYSMISLHPVANLLPTSGAIAAPKVSITIQRLQPCLVPPSKDSRGLLLSKTIILGFATQDLFFTSSINLTVWHRLTQTKISSFRPRARRRPPPSPPHMGTCRWPPPHWASRHRCRPRRRSWAAVFARFWRGVGGWFTNQLVVFNHLNSEFNGT